MAKEQYQKAANKKDLKEGCLLKIEPYCKSIVLAKVNGNVYDGFDILTWRWTLGSQYQTFLSY